MQLNLEAKHLDNDRLQQPAGRCATGFVAKIAQQAPDGRRPRSSNNSSEMKKTPPPERILTGEKEKISNSPDLFYTWIAMPSAASAASITASFIEGWAWIVRAMR